MAGSHFIHKAIRAHFLSNHKKQLTNSFDQSGFSLDVNNQKGFAIKVDFIHHEEFCVPNECDLTDSCDRLMFPMADPHFIPEAMGTHYPSNHTRNIHSKRTFITVGNPYEIFYNLWRQNWSDYDVKISKFGWIWDKFENFDIKIGRIWHWSTFNQIKSNFEQKRDNFFWLIDGYRIFPHLEKHFYKGKACHKVVKASIAYE